MIIFLVIGLAVLVAIAWRRVDARHERYLDAIDRLAAQGARTAQLLATALERERDAQRDIIADLCQRVQAPQAAVLEHHLRGQDADRGDMVDPLSDEQTVERQDAELIAALEQAEREQRRGVL